MAMGSNTKMTPTNEHLEHSWVLVGAFDNGLWNATPLDEREGAPARVMFDPYWVLQREDKKGDVVGFLHTHPTFPAIPSFTDVNTMQGWVLCFGRPLLCAIQGTDGLRTYLFETDECHGLEITYSRLIKVPSIERTMFVGVNKEKKRKRSWFRGWLREAVES